MLRSARGKRAKACVIESGKGGGADCRHYLVPKMVRQSPHTTQWLERLENREGRFDRRLSAASPGWAARPFETLRPPRSCGAARPAILVNFLLCACTRRDDVEALAHEKREVSCTVFGLGACKPRGTGIKCAPGRLGDGRMVQDGRAAHLLEAARTRGHDFSWLARCSGSASSEGARVPRGG